MVTRSLRQTLQLRSRSPVSRLPASVAIGLALPAAVLGIVLIGMDLHFAGMLAWIAAIVTIAVALPGIYAAAGVGALVVGGGLLWRLMLGGEAFLSSAEQIAMGVLTVLAGIVGRLIARQIQLRESIDTAHFQLDVFSITIDSILEASRDCIKVLGTDGSILSINEPGVKLIGAESAEQLVGKSWFAFWGAEQQKILSTAWHQALTRGHAQFEGSCRTLAGERRTWRNSFTLVRAPLQSQAHVICISCDVTDSVNLQQTLDATTAQLSGLLNHIDDVSFAVDSNWTIRFANRSGEELCTRLECPNAVSRSLWEIFPFKPGEPASILIRRVMEEKVMQSCEYFFPRQQIWLSITAFSSGNGINILARDITLLKQTQKTSVEEAARLQVAQEIAGFGDWGFDYDQGSMSFSTRAIAMLEMDNCPPHHYKKHLLEKLNARDRMALVQSIINCTESEPTMDLIVSFPGSDGVDKYLHWIGRLLTDERGNATRMLGAIQDVSEHMNAQHSLEKARSLVRDLVDALPQQVLVIDTEGMLVVANQTWLESRKRHYRRSETPDNFFELNDTDENTRAIIERAHHSVRTILSGEQPAVDYEYTVDCGSAPAHFLVQVRPLRNGDELFAVLVHQEITPLKKTMSADIYAVPMLQKLFDKRA